MKVALAPPSFRPVKRDGTELPGTALFAAPGPRTVLGWKAGNLAEPLAPSPTTLFGPRGACLHPDGSLWVADTGHHRLLGWRETPLADNAPAEILLGQPDFTREGRNAKGMAGPATFNVPTGICAWRGGLALADAWNHRVLLWKTPPTRNNQPADLILGQSSGTAVQANRGSDHPTAASLHWPYGVAEIGGRLVVCDSGNRRVLVWNDPGETGQAADLVLGQHRFDRRDENAGSEVSAMSMRWPHGAAWWDGRLVIADSGNNRMMVWNGFPQQSGAACDSVLGQTDAARCDHNMSSYYPSAQAVNMPYAVAAGSGRLIVADTANSRMLGWDESVTGSAAQWLSCQPDFASKGDNRWGIPVRDSVCWPYGLGIRDDLVAIADSGNNRVLLWTLAS